MNEKLTAPRYEDEKCTEVTTIRMGSDLTDYLGRIATSRRLKLSTLIRHILIDFADERPFGDHESTQPHPHQSS